MARLLAKNNNPGSVILDATELKYGMDLFANKAQRAEAMDMPIYVQPGLSGINAFLSQEALAKKLDPQNVNYSTVSGLAFWFGAINNDLFVIAIPATKTESSGIPVNIPDFLANINAPNFNINQLATYAGQVKASQYAVIKQSGIVTFQFDATELAHLAAITPVVNTSIEMLPVFIKDEKSQLDCLSLTLVIDANKAYGALPCPPVCYYG